MTYHLAQAHCVRQLALGIFNSPPSRPTPNAAMAHLYSTVAYVDYYSGAPHEDWRHRICFGIVNNRPKVTFATLHEETYEVQLLRGNRYRTLKTSAYWTAPTPWHGSFHMTDRTITAHVHYMADDGRLRTHRFPIHRLRWYFLKPHPQLRDATPEELVELESAQAPVAAAAAAFLIPAPWRIA